MINLYKADEQNFNHNQWTLSECTLAKVTEDLEGILDLDLEYPLFDTKGLSKYLVRGNIIKCPISNTDSRGEQLFRIRKKVINTKAKRVIIYAQAIGRADLMKNWIAGCRVLAGNTRKQAIAQILANCVEQQGYYAGTLDTNTNTNINLGLEEDTGNVINYLDVDVKNPLAGLIDNEKSVKKAYGGEIIFNNKEVNMVDERGTDHSVIISSGKNLEELEEEVDDLDSENFATALTMKSSDGLYLPNQEIIYSPNASTLGKYLKLIVCDDVTAVDDTQEAINVVYAQLRERAQKAFDNGIDKLKINNTINFIQLANTEEYKNYVELEKCEMGNNVTVKYPHANVEATGRVIKIVFNVLKMKIEEVEIGERRKPTFVETVTNTENKTKVIDNKTNVNAVNIKKAKKATKDLQVVMEKRDGEIELSITNLATNTETRFTIQDGKIDSKVSNDTFNSIITQQANLIASKVSESDFGTLVEQNSRSVAIAIKGETDTNIIFNSSGQTIRNGALVIEDSNSNDIMTFTSGGTAVIKDIDIQNTSTSSDFYRTLQNMDEIELTGILNCSYFNIGSASNLKIDGEPIRSYIDGRIDLKI